MRVARGQAWLALGIGGVALVVGLVASRDEGHDPADELRRYGEHESARKRAAIARARAVAVDVDQLAAGAPAVRLEPTTFEVAVTALAVRVDGDEVSDDELVERARRIAAADPDATVMLQADADAPYQRIVEVMELLKRAGLARIAFTAKP